jgi:hypothetical protein
MTEHTPCRKLLNLEPESPLDKVDKNRQLAPIGLVELRFGRFVFELVEYLAKIVVDWQESKHQVVIDEAVFGSLGVAFRKDYFLMGTAYQLL